MSLTVDALKKLHDNGLFAVPPVVPPPVNPDPSQAGVTDPPATRDQAADAGEAVEDRPRTAQDAYDPVIHPFDDLRPGAHPDEASTVFGEPTGLPPSSSSWRDLPSCELPTEQHAVDDCDLPLPEPAADWMDLPEAAVQDDGTDHLPDMDSELPTPAVAAPPPTVPTYEQTVLERLSDPDYAKSFLRLLDGVQSRCGSCLPASLLTVSPHATSRSAELIIHMALIWGKATEEMLLIDANLQEQTLTRSLNALGQPGLCDVLSSMALPEDVVRTTSLPRLHFVPCGDDPTGISRGADTLDHDLLQRVLQQWYGRYDRVLIDVGPIDATLARPLALLCDASLLVVCMRDVALPQLHHAAETLRSCNRQVLGCVLTDAFESARR